jgi:hypothetical protein
MHCYHSFVMKIKKAKASAKRPGRQNLAEAIRRHIAPLGGIELTLPRREAVRRPPNFGNEPRATASG